MAEAQFELLLAATREQYQELRAIHPLGKAPVITNDGLTIAESGAIIEYLVERYGQGRIVDNRIHLCCREWDRRRRRWR